MGPRRLAPIAFTGLALAASASACAHPTPPVGRPAPVAVPVRLDPPPLRSLDELVSRPIFLRDQEPIGVSDPVSPAPAPALPPPPPLVPRTPIAPSVLHPGRPSAGGSALELADLALLRGDALDAAAQYRAVLRHAAPSYAPYVHLQLARACEVLGDRRAAFEHFRDAARAPGPVGWAALTRLAEQRATEVGVLVAVDELSQLASMRVGQLEAHLLPWATDAEATTIVVRAATRTQDCGLAFEAYLRDAALPPRLLDLCRPAFVNALSPPWNATARSTAPSPPTTPNPTLAPRRVAATNAYLARLDAAGPLWDRHAARVLGGDLDPAPWLELADTYRQLRRDTHATAPTVAFEGNLEAGAVAAIIVAVELARHQPTIDAALSRRLYDASRTLPETLRALAISSLAAAMNRGGAR
jgi:hypothetical protein